MDTSITFDDDALAGFLVGIQDQDYEQAFKDAVQVVLNSTKVGYMDEVSPDGESWKLNAEWYSVMKGGSATLTGPLSTKIKGGTFAGKYKFTDPNKKRMKNSLIWEIFTSQKMAVIEYDRGAEDRAEVTQEGGEADLFLSTIDGGSGLILDVTIPARPHLGLSNTYSRLGGKTDPELIEEIFAGMYDRSLARTVSDVKGLK